MRNIHPLVLIAIVAMCMIGIYLFVRWLWDRRT
jgi:hypothetical protein